MNEEKKAVERGWWPGGGCFAEGTGLPEMVAIKMRAMNNVAEVMQYIPGSAFYPAGSVCKRGRVPVMPSMSILLDGGDK